MNLTYHHPVDVLSFAAALDMRFAMVAAEAVTGGAMRAPGALMCVPESGGVAGYISNGCVDADIIYQARAAIKDGVPRRLRYGEGSPFKDIVLPCGGRIDLRVMPDMQNGVIAACAQNLTSRQEASLDFDIGGDVFSYIYTPKLSLRIAGRGEAVAALARQAVSTGFDVIVQSPDSELSLLSGLKRFDPLNDPSQPPIDIDDPWTAVVLMFHDHDWEPHLLMAALSGPSFYVGAMGSQRTHDIRKEALTNMGLTNLDIDRIHAPIGIIPSMRDGNLLAVSVLADIVLAAQKSGRL